MPYRLKVDVPRVKALRAAGHTWDEVEDILGTPDNPLKTRSLSSWCVRNGVHAPRGNVIVWATERAMALRGEGWAWRAITEQVRTEFPGHSQITTTSLARRCRARKDLPREVRYMRGRKSNRDACVRCALCLDEILNDGDLCIRCRLEQDTRITSVLGKTGAFWTAHGRRFDPPAQRRTCMACGEPLNGHHDGGMCLRCIWGDEIDVVLEHVEACGD